LHLQKVFILFTAIGTGYLKSYK